MKRPREEEPRRTKLGSGSFGRVYVDPKDETRAIKVASIYENGKLVVSNLKESILAILYLSAPRSKHLVKYEKVSFEDESVHLLMHREKGNLSKWIYETPFMKRMEHVHEIVEQILRGVDSLHKLGLSHGDLKPSNVLFSTEGSRMKAVVTDLGSGLLTRGGSEVSVDMYVELFKKVPSKQLRWVLLASYVSFLCVGARTRRGPPKSSMKAFNKTRTTWKSSTPSPSESSSTASSTKNSSCLAKHNCRTRNRSSGSGGSTTLVRYRTSYQAYEKQDYPPGSLEMSSRSCSRCSMRIRKRDGPSRDASII